MYIFHVNWATPSAEEDHVIQTKAPEQLPCGEIDFVNIILLV